MLEIKNLESNKELTKQEKQYVCGGAAAFLANVAYTTADAGVRAWFGQPVDPYYWTSAAQRTAIFTGTALAFTGPKGAALS